MFAGSKLPLWITDRLWDGQLLQQRILAVRSSSGLFVAVALIRKNNGVQRGDRVNTLDTYAVLAGWPSDEGSSSELGSTDRALPVPVTS